MAPGRCARMMLPTRDSRGGKPRGVWSRRYALGNKPQRNPCFPLPIEPAPGNRAATLPRKHRIERSPPNARWAYHHTRSRKAFRAQRARFPHWEQALRRARRPGSFSSRPPLNNTRPPTLASQHSSRACCPSSSAGRHGSPCSTEPIGQHSGSKGPWLVFWAAKPTKASYF